jgi:hypothetical protein
MIVITAAANQTFKEFIVSPGAHPRPKEILLAIGHTTLSVAHIK